MNTVPYGRWIEGFQIFAKYDHIDDTSAEHEIFYAGPDPEVVSEEDLKRLDELGWFPQEKYNCFAHFT